MFVIHLFAITATHEEPRNVGGSTSFSQRLAAAKRPARARPITVDDVRRYHHAKELAQQAGLIAADGASAESLAQVPDGAPSTALEELSALDAHLASEGHEGTLKEGHCGESASAVELLRSLVPAAAAHIAEVGFNGGHSATLFLTASPAASVTSFELGQHAYSRAAVAFLARQFPGRHTVIWGNSTQTLPVHRPPGGGYDLILLDGAHHHEVAALDLANARALAHANTLVVMDDVVLTSLRLRTWNLGPTAVWLDARREGRVKELGHRELGEGRGIAWGAFV